MKKLHIISQYPDLFATQIFTAKRRNRPEIVAGTTAALIDCFRLHCEIRPKDMDFVVGKKATRDVQKDQQLIWKDIEGGYPMSLLTKYQSIISSCE